MHRTCFPAFYKLRPRTQRNAQCIQCVFLDAAATRRVDRAKAVDAIKERKQKQAQAQGGEGAAPLAAASAPAGGEGAGAHTIRHYGQRRAKPDPVSDASAPRMADDVLAMLAQSRKKQRAG